MQVVQFLRCRRGEHSRAPTVAARGVKSRDRFVLCCSRAFCNLRQLVMRWFRAVFRFLSTDQCCQASWPVWTSLVQTVRTCVSVQFLDRVVRCPFLQRQVSWSRQFFSSGGAAVAAHLQGR